MAAARAGCGREEGRGGGSAGRSGEGKPPARPPELREAGRPERGGRGRGRGEPAVGCGDWLRVPPETAGRGRGGPGPS